MSVRRSVYIDTAFFPAGKDLKAPLYAPFGCWRTGCVVFHRYPIYWLKIFWEIWSSLSGFYKMLYPGKWSSWLNKFGSCRSPGSLFPHSCMSLVYVDTSIWTDGNVTDSRISGKKPAATYWRPYWALISDRQTSFLKSQHSAGSWMNRSVMAPNSVENSDWTLLCLQSWFR